MRGGETVIYLYEGVKVKDKYDLIRFDSSGAVSTGMFDEDWLRLVIKMATGSGKTKVMSLIMTWCYFHKLYEPDSKLATNFLVIAPNIIVLDRLRTDADISTYYPDFFVKTGERDIFIVETKGLEEIDVPLKMERLKKWCADINQSQKKIHFDFVFVDEEDFEKYKPNSFEGLVKIFTRYKSS